MATLAIDDDAMISDTTPHFAVSWPVDDEPTLWSVSWLPGRALTRDQAITAMTIAEMVVERAHILADPQAKLWWHMEGWAEELGLTVSTAVEQASAGPLDGLRGADLRGVPREQWGRLMGPAPTTEGITDG